MITVNQGEQFLISPITKEKIPANSISAHTKYGKENNIFLCSIPSFYSSSKLCSIQHGFNDVKKRWQSSMKKNRSSNQVRFLKIYLCITQAFRLGSNVEMALKKLAERRTDIFGTGAQETIIGRKVRIIARSTRRAQMFCDSSRLAKKIVVPTRKSHGMGTQQQVISVSLFCLSHGSILSSGENVEESHGWYLLGRSNQCHSP